MNILRSIGNICRALGILSFLFMCYAWFFSSNLEMFLLAKQFTITFFGVSLFLWVISIVVAKRNK